MSSVWNANNIIDGFSPRPNTPIIIIWGSFFDTNRKYSQWHNPNEWKMAQHIPTRHKEGITRSILRSVRRATATLCSVPNHWTIIFKIRQTKKHLIPTCMQSGRRHGTACHSYGFFIRTKRQKKKKSNWHQTDVHPPIYIRLYTTTTAVTSHSTNFVVVSQHNPISNARSSLLIFHYVHFFWSAYLQPPSIPHSLRISTSRFIYRSVSRCPYDWLEIARLNDYYGVWWANIYPSNRRRHAYCGAAAASSSSNENDWRQL